MINKSAIYLMSCILLMSCDKENKKPDGSKTLQPETIQNIVRPAIELQTNLVKNKVFYASGVDLITGKPLVVNSLTGEIVEPCANSIIIVPSVDTNPDLKLKNYNKNTKTGETIDENCRDQIINPDPKLLDVINASKTKLSGSIKKNGKVIPAQFIISITAIYQGSDCITEYKNGLPYQELCINEGGAAHCGPTYSRNKLAGELYPAWVCPTCTTQEEVQLEVIKKMKAQHPECVGVIDL